MQAEKATFEIQDTKIVDKSLLENQSNEGARVIFVGLVRDYNKERMGVTHIEYQAYKEMAEKVGLSILLDSLTKFKINRVYCVHRIGKLQLQDTAIRLEIGSGHRADAIHACEYIMDEIKKQVPIWKKEFVQESALWI